jgi:uncharacterized protein YbjT (DUF2867 family)
MKILITGGTGFIGRSLINLLLTHAHQITVLSRDPDKAHSLFTNGITPLNDL